MATYLIVIEREKAFYGSAIKHTVELDGLSFGILKNGQSVTIHATAGSHVLTFINRGKVEKSIPLFIGPEDYITELSVRLNGRQKLEISKSVSEDMPLNNVVLSTSSAKKKKKPISKPVKVLITVIAAVFLVVTFFGQDSTEKSAPSKTVEPTETLELTDEEKAAQQLEKAAKKFESGDYMGAIKLCDVIESDYPATETASGISSFLEEQFANYPHYSAKELMAEYDANIVNADEEYNDVVMVITGTVSSIGKTNNDRNLAVMLNSDTYFYGVQLNFKTSQTDSVAALSEGDTVTAVGKCKGKSGKQLVILDGMNVMIENCYLIH